MTAPTLKAFHLAVLALFGASEVLGGVWRWLASEAGLAELAYLPKALLWAAMLAAWVTHLQAGRLAKGHAAATMVAGWGFLVGAMQLGRLEQAAFGLWSVTPLLAGLTFGRLLLESLETHRRAFGALWMVAAVGILLDVVATFPWSGSVVEVGGHELVASKAATTWGFDRLAGFSRSSFEASHHLLILGIGLVLGRRAWWAVPLWLGTGALVFATTVKTTLAAFALLTLMFLVPRGWRNVAWRHAMVASILAGLALPFSVLFVHYDVTGSLDSPIEQLIFASAGDRLELTWPLALDLAFEHGNLLVGRGWGGIGAAQAFFEPALNNPADALGIYVFVTLGVLGLLVLAALYARLATHRAWGFRDWYILLLATCIAILGLAANILEGPYPAIALGVVASHALQPRSHHA